MIEDSSLLDGDIGWGCEDPLAVSDVGERCLEAMGAGDEGTSVGV